MTERVGRTEQLFRKVAPGLPINVVEFTAYSPWNLNVDLFENPVNYLTIIEKQTATGRSWEITPKSDVEKRKYYTICPEHFFTVKVSICNDGTIDVFSIDDSLDSDIPRFYQVYIYDLSNQKLVQVQEEKTLFRRISEIVVLPIPSYFGGVRMIISDKDELEQNWQEFLEVL